MCFFNVVKFYTGKINYTRSLENSNNKIKLLFGLVKERDLLDFRTNKTEQYLQFRALMKDHVLLAIQAKHKLANCYYFSVAIDSCKILTQVGQEWRNLKALKRCYIKIYQSDFLPYYVKAIELQHI